MKYGKQAQSEIRDEDARKAFFRSRMMFLYEEENLPEHLRFKFEEAKSVSAAKRIIDIVRKRGKCNARGIAQYCGAIGGNAERRRKVITALVAAGLLHCSGLPNERGNKYWI